MAEALKVRDLLNQLEEKGLADLAVVEISSKGGATDSKIYAAVDLSAEQEAAISDAIADVICSSGDLLKEYAAKPDTVRFQIKDHLKRKSKVKRMKSFR